MLYNPPRGMKDLLPKRASLKTIIIDAVSKIYRQNGFHEVVTPALEELSSLMKYHGEENQKIIFRVLQRGQKLQKAIEEKNWENLADLGLRFDLTLPLMRLYAKYRESLPHIFKVYQIGNVWRAERPQRGRMRQFTQCDVDIIGTDSWISFYEVVRTGITALNKIFSILYPNEIKNFKVYINNRLLLHNTLLNMGFDQRHHNALLTILDKLDKISMEDAEKLIDDITAPKATKRKLMDWIQNPLGADSSSQEENLPITQEMQNIIEHLKKTIPANFTIEFKPQLARGMGYYTGYIFEMNHEDSCVVGGGEYQNVFTAPEQVCACGMSVGLDRILEMYEDQQWIDQQSKKLAILVQNDVNISKLDQIIKKYLHIKDQATEKKQNMHSNNFQCISIMQASKKTGKQIYRLAEIMGYTHVWLYMNHHQTPEIKSIKESE